MNVSEVKKCSKCGNEDLRARALRPEKGVSQEAAYRSGLQLPEDTVQLGHKQVQRLEKRRFLRALQPIMPGSEQRSSRKHQKTRQSSLTNLLQYIIKGQGSALSARAE
jgi:hypothetical protein